MYVMKRNNTTEPIHFDKITNRLQSLMSGLDSSHVDISRVAQKVISGLYPGVRTSDLDNLAAETAAYMSTTHPDYGRLAARISISNLHKETAASFSETIDKLFKVVDPKTMRSAGLIEPNLAKLVLKYKRLIDSKICNERDFDMTYFGFKTLERAYLLRDIKSGKTLER